MFAQERADRKAERDKRIADTEETLQDRLTLAGFTEGKDDDLKRLKALERFYGLRVRAAERFCKEQRKWRIKLRGIQKDIRDLNEEEAESVSTPTRSFAQATFDFMQRQQGFTSQYLSNLLDPDGRVPNHAVERGQPVRWRRRTRRSGPRVRGGGRALGQFTPSWAS